MRVQIRLRRRDRTRARPAQRRRPLLAAFVALLAMLAACSSDQPAVATETSLTVMADLTTTTISTTTGPPTTTSEAPTTTTTTAVPPTTTSAPGCAATRLPVPCPLHDGQSVNLEPTGLPPLTTITVGLCLAATDPTPEDCTPGTTYFDNRSAVVDPAGAARLSLVAERHLLLRDRTVDCAVNACELRTLIQDRQSGETLTTYRDRVQFSDPAQLTLDLGDPFALTPHTDHVLRLQSTNLDLGRGITVEQCTRSTIKLAFGVDYPSCIRIPTGDVELAGGTATVHFSPSRWAFPRGTVVDCALASHPCWLSVLIGGNFAARASIAVAGNAARPTLTATPHDGLRDRAEVTLTLAAAPPRQWATIVYCLDDERTRQAPPAQGDGADGCTDLDADLSPLGTDPRTAWPPNEITIRATVPRFLRWYDTDYDCADTRGCRIVYLSGSDTFADFGLDVAVHFTP